MVSGRPRAPKARVGSDPRQVRPSRSRAPPADPRLGALPHRVPRGGTDARPPSNRTGMGRLIRGLTRNRAWTDPESPDRRLRGRVYDVPFTAVWRAALELARAQRGWTVTETDARDGEIVVEARTTLWKFVDDVSVRVWLDEAGATRVDLTSASRVGRGDLGTNARRIARFLHALDRRVLPRAGRGETAKASSSR